MEIKVMYLKELQFNIDAWKRELRFHFDEMDAFQEKLDELTAMQELDIVALKKLDIFQNRILLEKDAIAKLKHRSRHILASFNRAAYENNIDDSLFIQRSNLRDDMRNYIQLHYILKEEIIDFLLEKS